MWAGVDSLGYEKVQKRDNNMYWIAYFIFIIFGLGFFMFNLFVGIVVYNYEVEG